MQADDYCSNLPMDCRFQPKYQRLQFKLGTQNYYLVRTEDDLPKIEFRQRYNKMDKKSNLFQHPTFRPYLNSVETDSGIYSALENSYEVSSHFRHEKWLDPTMLIDRMLQRLNNLDLNISIALGHILSVK